MGQLNSNESWERAAVEDALRSLPESDAPAGLHPAVLRRVRSLPRPGRFRLNWLDLALLLFSATLLAAGSAAWMWIPTIERLRLYRQAILFWQGLRLAGLDLLLLGMGMLVIVSFAIWLSFTLRPRRTAG